MVAVLGWVELLPGPKQAVGWVVAGGWWPGFAAWRGEEGKRDGPGRREKKGCAQKKNIRAVLLFFCLIIKPFLKIVFRRIK